MYLLVVLNLAYFKNVTTYLPLVQSALKYFVILFLMLRFNPYSHDNFSEFDKKSCFRRLCFYYRQLQSQTHYYHILTRMSQIKSVLI